MRYLALCCDYDGTIAHHGRVDEPTIAALERLRESGRKLVLVTGRELDELQTVMPRLDLFARVVAENGALLYRPETREEQPLDDPPPQSFVDKLVERGVGPISVGRVIVATWEPHENTVLKTIRDCGLELQVIFNKGAVMVLPAGVNKASGLRAALAEINLSRHNAVAVGDAENDHAFFNICECAVAVANALPAVKEKADIVTFADHGAGVTELIEEMLADDLASREGGSLARHDILLGKDAQGKRIALSPFRVSALVVGSSGSGKSTVVAGLVERLRAAGYNFCIIDPEGDYDSVESAVVLGGPEHAPTIDECVQLLSKPDQNAVINLLGVKLNDRPWFFLSLFTRVRELRARTGRPHWLIVDEAHHAMPANWRPTDQNLPERLEGVLAVSVSPKGVAPSMLRALDTIIVLGDRPREMLHEFTDANRVAPAEGAPEALEAGTGLLWSKAAGGEPTLLRVEPSRTERRRHLRKYAEGELAEDRSFYFRGPEGKLNLRAHNLVLFMDLADGVDDETWLFHLRRGEVSRWLRQGIKDETLANQAAAIERNGQLDAAASRRKMRELIEATYTLPAQ
jgi:hydroxymethylpyrimidine pyrophosphatase-like HAD family hydrolase